MARPRTPTNVLDARGAFRKNPQRGRARAGEPKPTGTVGEPPQDFNPAEVRAWQELVAVAPAHVLTNMDRHALEMAATLIAEFRDCRRLFPANKIGHLRLLLSSMGMTPADRSKVVVPKKDDDNPFSDL